MKRTGKLALGVAGAVILLATIFIYYFVTGGPATVTSDITDYRVFENYEGYSNLEIFPAEIPASAADVNYCYYYRDDFLDPSCQIFLRYVLSDDEYYSEKERLSNIVITFDHDDYRNIKHEIVYDSGHFSVPAYVTAFNNNQTFEYALLNEEEKSIAYVFTQFVPERKVRFDEAYLPSNFDGEGYNLYLSGMTSGYYNITVND